MSLNLKSHLVCTWREAFSAGIHASLAKASGDSFSISTYTRLVQQGFFRLDVAGNKYPLSDI